MAELWPGQPGARCLWHLALCRGVWRLLWSRCCFCPASGAPQGQEDPWEPGSAPAWSGLSA